FDLVPAGGADHRVRNAGVARGRIEDRFRSIELAAVLAFEDHARGRTILDRPAGVLPLRLCVQFHARRLALELVETHQRGPSDYVEDGRARGAIKNGSV